MRALAYARKSTRDERADEAKSVTQQIEHVRAFAEKKGWTLADRHIFKDDGVSGRETASLTGRAEMFEAAERGEADVLVVFDLDRLTRDDAEPVALLKRLKDAGLDVWESGNPSAGPIPLAKVMDRFLVGAKGMAKALEAEAGAERTHRALSEKARKGHATGKPPFGFRVVDIDPTAEKGDKRYVIEESEATIVRDIFARIAGGKGFRSTALALNAEGIASPKPYKRKDTAKNLKTVAGWTPNGLKALLTNEIYRGQLVWNRTRSVIRRGRKTKVARPESEWIIAELPAELRIVPQELWDRAHARLAASREVYLRNSAGRLDSKPESGLGAKYLLSGFLKCSLCHGNLIAVENGRAYVCSTAYKRGASACSATKRHSLKALDERVLALLDKRVLSVEALEELAEQYKNLADRAEQSDREKQVIAAEVADITAERERLVDVVAKGLSSSPAILAAIQQKDQALTDAKARLEHAEGEGGARAYLRSPEFRERFLATVEAHRAYLAGEATPSVAVQRAVLRKHASFITVAPDGGLEWPMTLKNLTGEDALDGITGVRSGEAARTRVIPVAVIRADRDGLVELASAVI